MKIQESKKRIVEFEDLLCGSVFKCQGDVFMAAEESELLDHRIINAVDLSTGLWSYFCPSTKVYYLPNTATYLEDE